MVHCASPELLAMPTRTRVSRLSLPVIRPNNGGVSSRRRSDNNHISFISYTAYRMHKDIIIEHTITNMPHTL